MARRYVSLKEVARQAGVSFQTAGKVLNGGSVRVAPETAARIVATANRLGYTPNSVARSLVRRSTMTIGLVADTLNDPALAEFIVGAEAAAQANSLSFLVGSVTAPTASGAQVVSTLIERRLDGIICAAPQLEEDAQVGELLRRFVPAVSLHHVAGGQVPMLGSDHTEVGRLAIEHLLEIGCQRIGTVTGPAARRVVRSRRRGASAAFAAANVASGESLIVEADWSPSDAARATAELVARHPDLDGVFVHSDRMALAVLDALHALGRRVPEEVAVVSCDDLDFAAHLRPALSTVRLPFRDTGARAVELLLRRIGGEQLDPDPVILPVELVARQSSARVSTAAVASTRGDDDFSHD